MSLLASVSKDVQLEPGTAVEVSMNGGEEYVKGKIESYNDEGTYQVDIDGTSNAVDTQWIRCIDSGLIRKIIEEKVDLHQTNEKGKTVLMYACSMNLVEYIQPLLDLGVDINAQDKAGFTCLFHAIEAEGRKDDPAELVQLLVTNGVDVNIHEESGATAACMALTEGAIKCLQVLIDAKCNITEEFDIEGQKLNLLVLASISASDDPAEVIKMLISANVDASIRFGDDNWTLLMFSAIRGFVKSMEVLVQAGCDLNAQDNNGITALMYAASMPENSCHMDAVRMLVDAGASVNQQDMSNRTVLMIAAENGACQAVEYLIGSGADASITSDNGFTALMCAMFTEKAASDPFEIVKILLSVGSVVNITNASGETPLMCAVAKGWLKSAEFLIEHGADVTIVDENNYGLLLYAVLRVEEDPIEMVKVLVSAGADVNVRSSIEWENFTAFHLAISKGFERTVQYFIELGCDINEEFDVTGTTTSPLMIGILGQSESMVKMLIAAGANIHWKTSDGDSLLMFTPKRIYLDTAKYLLDQGLDVNEANCCGSTPIVAVADCDSEAEPLELLKLLVSRGADIHKRDNKGKNALIGLAKKGRRQCVQYLVELGCDVNVEDEDGCSVLIHAVNKKDSFSLEFVEYLISVGANVNHCNKAGKSVLSFAAYKEQVEAVKILINHGANVNTVDETGKTALRYAADGADNESTDMFQLFIDAGADVTIIAKDGSSVMAIAGKEGWTNIIDILLSKGGNADSEDAEGITVLMNLIRFAKSDPYEVVEKLMINGADAKKRSKHGHSALMFAAQKGWIKAMDVLAEKGCDVNWQDENGKTALMYALNSGLETIQRLIALAADVKLQNKDGHSVFSLALVDKPDDVVQFLIEKGCDSILKDDGCKIVMKLIKESKSDPVDRVTLLIDGGVDIAQLISMKDSVLLAAAYKHWLKTIPYLVSKGFDVMREDGYKGNTVMHELVGSRGTDPVEVLKVFVSLGADVTRPNKHKETLLTIAAGYEYLETVRWLLDMGLDVNAQNWMSKTALLTATSYCESDPHQMVSLLIDRGADVNLLDEEGVSALKNVAAKNFVKSVELLVLHGAFHSYVDESPSLAPIFSDKSMRESRAVLCRHDMLTLPLLQRFNYDLWFLLVQVRDLPGIEDEVRQLIESFPELVDATDVKNRVAIDVATPTIKSIIDTANLWFGKYRPAKGKSEYTSPTCTVVKCVDESGSSPVPVALKLMRLKSQFQCEIAHREKSFDTDFVMKCLDAHAASTDCDEVPSYDVQEGKLTKALAEAMYCVVMPQAECTLAAAIKQEHFAGKEDTTDVVVLFNQVVKCVMHMHEKGSVHCDINTLNIVRLGGKWILIDLDAACDVGQEFVCQKSSSALCIPPESVSSEGERKSVTVQGSFDVWSLGCVLYELCTTDATPLFSGDVSDPEQSPSSLAAWSDELKDKKLSMISNLKARNLLSLMLMKDPPKRPSLSRVLGHSFLSNNSQGRLPGEPAEFDVFISYRVFSDLKHAERLYDMLTAKGLRVWWDKKCLKFGVEWQQGFCHGLGASHAFVCILSKQGMHDQFRDLQANSFCDNVLLEHRLALELKQIDYIKYIFPIMVGEEVDPTAEHEGTRYSMYRTAYNESKSHNDAVENILKGHMNELGLGTPLKTNRSVYDIANDIRACNGYFIGGRADNSFENAVEGIVSALKQGETALAKDVSGKSSKAVSELRQAVAVSRQD